jgi:hypothetical protein
MSFGLLSCSGDRRSRDLGWGQFGCSGGGREDRSFHSMRETQLSGEGGGAGCVNRVNQECLEGWLVVYVGCFEPLTDCLSPAIAAHSIFTSLIT